LHALKSIEVTNKFESEEGGFCASSKLMRQRGKPDRVYPAFFSSWSRDFAGEPEGFPCLSPPPAGSSAGGKFFELILLKVQF
jgi:hypothetical protein